MGVGRPTRPGLAVAVRVTLTRSGMRFCPLDVSRRPGYRRYAWDAAELECREWFVAAASQRGLDVDADGNGNLWAWWGDAADGGAVVVGSAPGLGSGRWGVRRPARGGLGLRGDRRRSRQRDGAYPAGRGGRLLRRGGRPVRRRMRGLAASSPVPCRRTGRARSPTRAARPWPMPCVRPDTIRTASGRTRSTRSDRLLRRAPRRAGPGRPVTTGTAVAATDDPHGLVELGAPVGVATAIWPHGRWRVDLQAGPTMPALLGCEIGQIRCSSSPPSCSVLARPRHPSRRARYHRQGRRPAGRRERDPFPRDGLARRARTDGRGPGPGACHRRCRTPAR